MVANKSSRYVWAYESTPGTAEITAVDTVTYEFGEYNEECGQWNTPFVENPTQPKWNHDSRTPTLTELERMFPVFSHTFNPVTAQFLAWMLKKPVANDPSVDIDTLDVGLTYPLTIRHEELGGTVPALTQAVGCYAVGLTCKAERDKSFLAEIQFAWQKIEDLSNTTRPILTTPPIAPGKLAIKPYNGNPIIIWNSGGGGSAVSIPQVWRADFQIQQDHEIVSRNLGVTQGVYTHKIQPIRIILSAVFEAQDMWDDYVNRVGTYEMTLQIKKHDNTSNILYQFDNCRIITIKKTGDRNKGHYGAICVIEAEQMSASNDWYTETGAAGGDFATHWKAAVV